MSDSPAHHCGLTLVRLRRDLGYYRERYADAAWGLRQVYLLLEKQHNRGQDGAGLAVVKFDMPPGEPFLKRLRSDRHNAIERIFDVVMRDVRPVTRRPHSTMTPGDLKLACEFLGELYLGHLRYATYSTPGQANCHPYVRRSNVASRNLAIAGNFNMTNAPELFAGLVRDGLSPVGDSDTLVILERLGHSLDREHDRLAREFLQRSPDAEGQDVAADVSRRIDLVRVVREAAADWDGGYVLVGLVGNGDAFVARDPNGIRPGYFYEDDDVVVAASERIAIAGVLDVPLERIEAVQPGHVLEIKRDGSLRQSPFAEVRELRQCTFERVYFSRGNDPDIYRERKALGRNLAPRVLAALDGDLEKSVFSFIPNTAEAAHLGLVETIRELTGGRVPVRTERLSYKDQRLRTFIAHDATRLDLVTHVYDVAEGVTGPADTLVMLDDSIVRGTTLRESIIGGLSRLNPARIVIVSSAPPVMYPDCYGIDISRIWRFIAFEAAVALLYERGEQAVCAAVEARCRAELTSRAGPGRNEVSALYERFSLDELSAKVAELIRPKHSSWRGKLDVIYQDLDGLRSAIPVHTGDWCFTGRYPTPGGYRIVNQSYLSWREETDLRPYERHRVAQ